MRHNSVPFIKKIQNIPDPTLKLGLPNDREEPESRYLPQYRNRHIKTISQDSIKKLVSASLVAKP